MNLSLNWLTMNVVSVKELIDNGAEEEDIYEEEFTDNVPSLGYVFGWFIVHYTFWTIDAYIL